MAEDDRDRRWEQEPGRNRRREDRDSDGRRDEEHGPPRFGRGDGDRGVWRRSAADDIGMNWTRRGLHDAGDPRQGHRGEGPHRGRGPKGYMRSDERIREDVNDRLTEDSWLDASNIEVRVTAGEVTLGGTVAERLDKRRAEDLADSVSGVIDVQNNLRLHGREPQRPSAAPPTASPGAAAPTPGLTAETRRRI
jgi:hypothetical protein